MKCENKVKGKVGPKSSGSIFSWLIDDHLNRFVKDQFFSTSWNSILDFPSVHDQKIDSFFDFLKFDSRFSITS